MRANATQKTKHALNKERRLDETTVYEVGESVEMADVVTFDFEAGAILGAGRQDVLDIGESVAEDPVT